MSQITLREITDALALDDPGRSGEEEARAEYYRRARMLRDRGLIRSSLANHQGRVTYFTEADAVAAAVMICASRDGTSLGLLKAIHGTLRPFENTMGGRLFERYLDKIKAGKPVTIRVYIYRKPDKDHPDFSAPGVHVKMDDPGGLPDHREIAPLVSKSIDLPVELVAKPVVKMFQAS